MLFTTQASPWSYLALCRPRKIFNNSTLNQNISWDTWTQLVPIGNTEDRSGYYAMNDVTVGRRSFCLHTFGIFCEDKMSLIQSECVYFFKCCYTGEGPAPSPDPHHFSKLNFTSKILNFTMQINAYQERTKINTEVNEQPLKNIGTHWNI